MKQLEGKVAFITGGSRGMGSAIAKRLSQEGAFVAFTHSGKHLLRADEILGVIQTNGGKGVALVADSAHPEALQKAIQSVIDQQGPIDILVNNAGVYSANNIAENTLEEFDWMVATNVKAVFVASQLAAKYMKDGGRIITIGSNMADRVSFPGGGLYAMSKSALIGLTKGMARDLGSRNITVNLVQPGPIDTDMNPANSDHAPFLVEALAIKRYGKVEEIAGLVAYLASAEGQFVTGTTITIDGGFNI